MFLKFNNFTSMKNRLTIIAVFILLFIIPKTVHSQITYIDVYISQPNIEDCITNIETNFEKEEINVFPNPTEGIITINIEDVQISGMLDVSIYNIKGQIIYTNKIKLHEPKSKLQIDLTEHPPGSYLINISTKENQFRANLILD
jgi:hypothetical protein